MLHVCVKRFDVMVTVEIFLETKQGQSKLISTRSSQDQGTNAGRPMCTNECAFVLDPNPVLILPPINIRPELGHCLWQLGDGRGGGIF